MRLAPVIDAEAARLQPPPDFSLVLGGPLFQLYRRAHLSGDALELLRRRILVITLFAWLPLLLLAALERDTSLAGPSKSPSCATSRLTSGFRHRLTRADRRRTHRACSP